MPGTAASAYIESASEAVTETISETVSEPTSTVQTESSETTTEAAGMLDGIKIGLDPGHQAHANTGQEAVAPNRSETKYKVSSGTAGVTTGIPEYVTVLEIAVRLREKLEAEGATVYMTRETHDVDISNQERSRMMNAYGVDLMLRIHCDGAEDAATNGIGLFVSDTNAIADQSEQYAQIIQPIVCEIVGAKNRGIIRNDNYTGQNWAEVPCIMIECGFLSNPEEDVLLNDASYQELLAEGICEGIKACFCDNNQS